MNTKALFQRIIIIVLLLVIPVFIVCNFSLLRSKRDLSCDFFNDFLMDDEYLVDKAFVFILFVNSCDEVCEQNLSSILHQNYDKYRIIFLRSNESNESIQAMRQLAAKENKSHLLTIMESPSGSVTVESFRRAIESCDNDDIVIQMGCSDWLAHENVLEKLNKIYSSSKDVWLTYSQFLEYPSYRKGGNRPYVRRMLRDRYSKKSPWLSAPFKTYYAGLFKQIEPDQRLLHRRSLIGENLDLFMLPMVESSKNHIKFIDEVLFIHNQTETAHSAHTVH